MKTEGLWDLLASRHVNTERCFGEACCFHSQDPSSPRFETWRQRYQFSVKHH